MKVIDGDGHVVEPRHALVDYIEPQFRERAPQVVTDDSGVDLVRIDGEILFGRKGPTAWLTSANPIPTAWWGLARCLCRTPMRRPRTLGLFLGGISDLALAAASCCTYNDWHSAE